MYAAPRGAMSPGGALCAADEVNAVVLDLGTWQTKAGYAGDDTPKAVFPSVGVAARVDVHGWLPPTTVPARKINGAVHVQVLHVASPRAGRRRRRW